LIRRIKVSPRNPQSAAQVSQRGILRQCAQGYRTLTDAEQTAWKTAGAKYKSRPTLGQSGPLTGLQLYVKINAALLTIGDPVVNVPPAAPVPQPTSVVGLEATNVDGVVTLKLTTTDAPPEGTMLWACAPQSAGVSRPVGPCYLGTLGVPVASKIDISAAYKAKFGEPAADSRVFVQVNTNINGWEGLRDRFNVRIPAAA
jgi:hypothetical protein